MNFSKAAGHITDIEYLFIYTRTALDTHTIKMPPFHQLVPPLLRTESLLVSAQIANA